MIARPRTVALPPSRCRPGLPPGSSDPSSWTTGVATKSGSVVASIVAGSKMHETHLNEIFAAIRSWDGSTEEPSYPDTWSDGAGSSFNGDDDYFLTVAVPRADLTAAGISGNLAVDPTVVVGILCRYGVFALGVTGCLSAVIAFVIRI